MTGAPGLPAGPGLPSGRPSSHHVPWMPPERPACWRVGDLSLSGGVPGCWPEPPGEGGAARLALSADPASLSAARDFVRKSLADWGLTDLTWDAITVVSELFTNAITHAASPFPFTQGNVLRVVLLCQGDRLGILVTDPSARPPVDRTELNDLSDLNDLGDLDEFDELLLEESGRGLAIVRGLSRDWGWALLAGGGKAVWAVLDQPADPRADGP